MFTRFQTPQYESHTIIVSCIDKSSQKSLKTLAAKIRDCQLSSTLKNFHQLSTTVINSSSTLHQLFINSSSTLHQLSSALINSSSTLHQLFINSSSTLHQVFINSSSTFHQLFINSHQLFINSDQLLSTLFNSHQLLSTLILVWPSI